MKYIPAALVIFFTSTAFAEKATAVPSPGFAFAKVIVVLGLIVGLILVSAWFARRSGLVNFANNANFKVLASLPLGTREKAVLVQIGKQYLLLGVAPGSVSSLHTWEENENPLEQTVAEVGNSRTKAGVDFASQIKKLLTQGQAR